jgi:arginase family enzyme
VPPVVLSGDCVASLAVIAGLQQRGIRPGLVWFDAHGDFHTEATTSSGYLGGLPLAKAVGRGDLTLEAGGRQPPASGCGHARRAGRSGPAPALTAGQAHGRPLAEDVGPYSEPASRATLAA